MSTTILTHNGVTWTNIVHPTQEDIQALGDRFPSFHPLNLKDCLTELEYPKLDHYDHYLFLVVQIPYWDSEERGSRPAEVDIFIMHKQLITCHRGDLKPLVDMFAAAEDEPDKREEWMGRGASPLLYNLLNALVDYCFPIVQKIGGSLRHIEENLFTNNVQHLLHEVAVLRRNIIVLRNIFRPQQEIIHALITGSWPFVQEHLDPYWGDIGDHLAQLCLLMDQYSEVINGLSDTIDTLASHRIDEVVRLLTVTTVLTLPVTLLAAVFGMNVRMPFADHPMLFITAILLGILLTSGLVWYLRTKRWL